jgi:hypothetical protein
MPYRYKSFANGWVEGQSEEGHNYYWNIKSGESSWTLPGAREEVCVYYVYCVLCAMYYALCTMHTPHTTLTLHTHILNNAHSYTHIPNTG